MALSPVAADSLISVTTALIPGPSTSATLGVRRSSRPTVSAVHDSPSILPPLRSTPP